MLISHTYNLEDILYYYDNTPMFSTNLPKVNLFTNLENNRHLNCTKKISIDVVSGTRDNKNSFLKYT